MAGTDNRRVPVAQVAGAHGVHGRVKLRTFTDEPADVASFGPLSDADGARAYKVRVTGATRGGVIVEMSGVRTREEAEALKGLLLHADRDALPALDDAEDFYHADLVGLMAVTVEGRQLGTVRAIHNYGAGDILDVRPARGGGMMLPFTREVVPEIDLEAGELRVVLPDEIEVREAPEFPDEPSGQEG